MLIHILNILCPEIWKPLLKEIIKLQFIPILMVTTYTEHDRSSNMEATFRVNHKNIVYPVVLSLYIDEKRGVQGNTSMRELPRPNACIFLVPPDSSRCTDIIQFLKVMKQSYSHSHIHSHISIQSHSQKKRIF